MTRHLLDAWDSFVTMVFAGAPTEQRNMLKVAFYAGATTMFGQMIAVHQESDVDALAMELKEFAELSRRIATAQPPGDGKTKTPVNAAVMRDVEAAARKAFAALDASVDGMFRRNELGCALFVFSYLGSEMTYVSNSDRADMVKMLYEFLALNPPAMTWDEQHG